MNEPQDQIGAEAQKIHAQYVFRRQNTEEISGKSVRIEARFPSGTLIEGHAVFEVTECDDLPEKIRIRLVTTNEDGKGLKIIIPQSVADAIRPCENGKDDFEIAGDLSYK